MVPAWALSVAACSPARSIEQPKANVEPVPTGAHKAAPPSQPLPPDIDMDIDTRSPLFSIDYCSEAGRSSGFAIDADGDRIVIGAPYTNGPERYEAFACVGRLNETSVEWEGPPLEARSDDERWRFLYASAVSIHGDTVVVGNMGGDGGDGPLQVFERRGSAWSRVQLVSSPRPEAADASQSFGGAVTLHGDIMYVSAEDAETADRGGVVDVFSRQRGTWHHVASVAPPDAGTYGFGAALRSRGGLMVIGASGRAYLYEGVPTASLQFRTRLDAPVPPSPHSTFAESIAVSDTTIALGDRGAAAGDLDVAGVVHVYTRGEGGHWTHCNTLHSPSPVAGGGFGEGLELAGDALIVGEPGAAGGRGAAWVFAHPCTDPRPTSRLVAPADAPISGFGATILTVAGRILVAAPGSQKVYAFPAQGA